MFNLRITMKKSNAYLNLIKNQLKCNSSTLTSVQIVN